MTQTGDNEDVYTALVTELAYTLLPTSVMGLTIFSVGAFASVLQGDPLIIGATASGSIASSLKIVLMTKHRARVAVARTVLDETRLWEHRHRNLTFVIAASVAVLSSSMMRDSLNNLNVLGAALLFGYCAGVATRLSVRPYIACGAIGIAAIPPTLSAAFSPSPSNWMLASLLTVFVVAGLQSVLHLYGAAKKQITLRMETEKLAHIDLLTGLANRAALQKYLSGLSAQSDGRLCVHCFDLDGFKAINDQLGHSAGDDLLAELGSRLRAIVAHPSIAARIGGDEFVVVQPELESVDDAEQLANEIYRSCTNAYMSVDEPRTIGLSLGYAVSNKSHPDFSALFPIADKAAYRAKRKGGGIEFAS